MRAEIYVEAARSWIGSFKSEQGADDYSYDGFIEIVIEETGCESVHAVVDFIIANPFRNPEITFFYEEAVLIEFRQGEALSAEEAVFCQTAIPFLEAEIKWMESQCLDESARATEASLSFYSVKTLLELLREP